MATGDAMMSLVGAQSHGQMLEYEKRNLAAVNLCEMLGIDRNNATTLAFKLPTDALDADRVLNIVSMARNAADVAAALGGVDLLKGEGITDSALNDFRRDVRAGRLKCKTVRDRFGMSSMCEVIRMKA